MASLATSRLALAVALALGAFALPSPVIAEDTEAPLPTGEAIMDQYIVATGGLEAYAQLQNTTSRGTFEIPAAGIEGSIVIYHARPNKLYTRVESQAMGTLESGSNGEVFWERSMMVGPKIKEGQEREESMRDAIFDKFARWREIYKQVECTGVDSVGSEACYRVVATPSTGEPPTLYFSTESGLLLKVESIHKHQMGDIAIKARPQDYRSVGGVLVPHKILVRVLTQDRELTFTSIEHNTDIPEDRFTLPEEIQELVDKSSE